MTDSRVVPKEKPAVREESDEFFERALDEAENVRWKPGVELLLAA